jgi:hypothetical protein
LPNICDPVLSIFVENFLERIFFSLIFHVLPLACLYFETLPVLTPLLTTNARWLPVGVLRQFPTSLTISKYVAGQNVKDEEEH